MTVAALPHTEPKQWNIPDTWLHHDARSKRPEQIKATMLGQLWKHAETCRNLHCCVAFTLSGLFEIPAKVLQEKDRTIKDNLSGFSFE